MKEVAIAITSAMVNNSSSEDPRPSARERASQYAVAASHTTSYWETAKYLADMVVVDTAVRILA